MSDDDFDANVGLEIVIKKTYTSFVMLTLYCETSP